MARIRTIKPSFFFDSDLAELPDQTRLFFIGLWTQADRRGRLEDKPRELKAQLLPYHKADADTILQSLHPKFLVRYNVEGRKYIWIRKFEEHQRPHHTEAESTIPPWNGEVTVTTPLVNIEPPPVLKEAVIREGKGMEAVLRDKRTPSASSSPAIDPYILEVLSECPHLKMLTNGDSADWWSALIAAIEPYGLGKAWVNTKLRGWNTWLENNPARRSREPKRLRTRLWTWLEKDLDKEAKKPR